MRARLSEVAVAQLGEFWVDGHMRNIPDHFHAHARPKDGFFGRDRKAADDPGGAVRTVEIEPTFESWQAAARLLLRDGVPPAGRALAGDRAGASSPRSSPKRPRRRPGS